LLLAGAAPARAEAGAEAVEIEAMTSPELRDRIAAGTSTVLLPLGGTEQNGPHMVLGKHNARVRMLALRIARQLGRTVVAPVLAYVPEGAIDPPSQHMRWAGTISVPEQAFESLLEGAARSLRKAGLCHVVLLGDHGGYRASLERVAARISREWARSSGCRVLALPEYYRAAQVDFARALQSRGYAAAEIGSHAGLADTSLALAVDPALVRADLLSAAAHGAGAAPGVVGEPSRSSAELGRPGLDHIVEASVEAIRKATHPAP
jgi:creatinine amidohydrolase/Fe(II)-dependent formamide hydrolase-like protein